MKKLIINFLYIILIIFLFFNLVFSVLQFMDRYYDGDRNEVKAKVIKKKAKTDFTKNEQKRLSSDYYIQIEYDFNKKPYQPIVGVTTDYFNYINEGDNLTILIYPDIPQYPKLKKGQDYPNFIYFLILGPLSLLTLIFLLLKRDILTKSLKKQKAERQKNSKKTNKRKKR